MASVLFVTWDGGGNVPPAIGIGRALRDRGHAVRFLGHDRQRAALEQAGFPFEAFRQAMPWTSTDIPSGPMGAAKFVSVFSDRGPGDDLLATVEREPADLVVIDCLLFGAIEAAEAAGLPRAVLLHSFYAFMHKTWTRSPLAVGARLKRRNPQRLWSNADVALITTLEELDPADHPGPPFRYTGPVLRDRPRPSDGGERETPLVLASLSTIDYAGQRKTLQRVIDAIAEAPLRLVVTSGPAIDPRSLRPGPNTEIHRFVPHSQLMPQASLVIGHGGHSTAMCALAHGVPMLIMPVHPFLDHRMVGKALQGAGAGVVLSRSAAEAKLRRAVETILGNSAYAGAAARLGDGIRERDGAQQAADELSALLGERAVSRVA